MDIASDCNWFWEERKFWSLIVSVIITLIFTFFIVKVGMWIFDDDDDVNSTGSTIFKKSKVRNLIKFYSYYS